jgi:hypothetical protein
VEYVALDIDDQVVRLALRVDEPDAVPVEPGVL